MIFEKIIGIAACDSRGVMGRNGKLPWHYPEELKHFEDMTRGFPMIMGHKTYLSMPERYFKNRKVIIFSRQKLPSNKNPTNLFFVASLMDFFALECNFKDLYLVGGAQIFNLFLKENLVEEFLLTKIKSNHEGDILFPLSLLENWSEVKIKETPDFSIYRYFLPKSAHKVEFHADKNL